MSSGPHHRTVGVETPASIEQRVLELRVPPYRARANTWRRAGETFIYVAGAAFRWAQRVRLVALLLSLNERGIAARIPDHLAVSRRAEHLFGTAAKAALLARVSTITSGVAQQQWPTHRP